MWKKILYRSTQISTSLTRAITSADFCPSNSVSRCCNPPSFNFSSSSSSSRGRPKGRTFYSARNLIFPASSKTLTRDFANSFLKIESFFCSQSNSALKSHCWNCGFEPDNTTPFLFCQACRSVQPVDETIDYFQIFGQGREYKLEVDKLEKKYKDWQKKLHPDLVHSKSKREREYAAEQSARVIDAYRTLTDPLSRAIYILKLEGVLVDEEERITDPELLAEIMELREAVDEADDTRALNEIQSQLREKVVHLIDSFEDAYQNKNFEDALASVRRMTYYRRASEEIVKKV
ncbi:DNAJ heat shock N-terminal domain-containing protein [Striga hermonthica]|uniref:DNAJ heat shock N-terminal domain-containing protein n=1 Tax=Striga hermonthica TaxID=68872 RepID=A0A9N7MSL7_STRHE|nr:DNAJ heat shock N-terminal domain-containing protein [Striga hermonthica]